jgi:MFS family permease
MACGVVLLTLITRPWQVYASFGVMSLGWATMSGAAINIIVAPWFERRRGLALSWAMNGGSAGGVLLAPLLILSICSSVIAASARYGGRTDARVSYPGDDAAASAKTPQRA